MGQASEQSISCGTRNNFIMSSFVERECIVVGDCTVLSMCVCVCLEVSLSLWAG